MFHSNSSTDLYSELILLIILSMKNQFRLNIERHLQNKLFSNKFPNSHYVLSGI